MTVCEFVNFCCMSFLVIAWGMIKMLQVCVQGVFRDFDVERYIPY